MKLLHDTCPLRITLLGAKDVGKSAFSVRYLTKRFIGEYKSDTDLLYKCVLKLGGAAQSVEIMDTSAGGDSEHNSPSDVHRQWGEAFIIVYSITDKQSFTWAQDTIKELSIRRPQAKVMILGNKSDLSHLREVEEIEARTLSLTHGARFQEVSTAESCKQVTEAFDNFLKTVKDSRVSNGISGGWSNGSPKQRKLSVSRMLGSLLGRQSPPPHPITELIILDKEERNKLKSPVRHL